MSEPVDVTALIAEAREYGDALQANYGDNWTNLVLLVENLADALEVLRDTTTTEWAARLVSDPLDMIRCADETDARETADYDKSWCTTAPREVVSRQAWHGPWVAVVPGGGGNE